MGSSVGSLLANLLPKSVTQEQVEEAGLNMVAEIMDFVTACYPQISLETVEKNLSVFQYLKRQDDSCKACMGIEMCMTRDGNRMNGKLMADGIVTIWFESCPRGRALTKHHAETASEKAERKWKKSESH